MELVTWSSNRCRDVVISKRAPESATMNDSRSAGQFWSIGRYAAPALMIARAATINSGDGGRQMAATSPRARPARWSTPCTLLVRDSNCPYESCRPAAIIATASGHERICSSILPTTLEFAPANLDNDICSNDITATFKFKVFKPPSLEASGFDWVN